MWSKGINRPLGRASQEQHLSGPPNRMANQGHCVCCVVRVFYCGTACYVVSCHFEFYVMRYVLLCVVGYDML